MGCRLNMFCTHTVRLLKYMYFQCTDKRTKDSCELGPELPAVYRAINIPTRPAPEPAEMPGPASCHWRHFHCRGSPWGIVVVVLPSGASLPSHTLTSLPFAFSCMLLLWQFAPACLRYCTGSHSIALPCASLVKRKAFRPTKEFCSYTKPIRDPIPPADHASEHQRIKQLLRCAMTTMMPRYV